MEKWIEIVGDTNDGDYITNRETITDEQLKEIQPVIDAIKKASEGRYGHNYDTSEYGERNAEGLFGKVPGFDLFDELVPYGEHGIHTIDSIIVLEGTATSLL